MRLNSCLHPLVWSWVEPTNAPGGSGHIENKKRDDGYINICERSLSGIPMIMR